MNKQETFSQERLEALLLRGACDGAEQRLRDTLTSRYDGWAAHRLAVRRDRRNYLRAATVALVVGLTSGAVGELHAGDAVITTTTLSRTATIAMSDAIVAAL